MDLLIFYTFINFIGSEQCSSFYYIEIDFKRIIIHVEQGININTRQIRELA